MENRSLLNKRIKDQFTGILDNIDVSIAGILIDEFFSNDEHVSATVLKNNLAEKGVKIGLDEVKKALKVFVEYGFARELKFEGTEEPHYEHDHLGVHHDHFICTKCGKIIEFEDDEMESIQMRNARKHAFYPLHHKMEIYGLCQECSGKSMASMMLSEAPVGARVTLKNIVGGGSMQQRLTAMGLLPGETVEILANEYGPVIIAKGVSRLAIGRGMANKINISME
jgi:Fur family ferric uptake transcriptional regulator